MKKILFLFFASIALTNPILATGVSSATKTINGKTFENCHVADIKNMLTDKVSHLLWCAVEKFTDKTEILFQANANGFLVGQDKGTQFSIKDYIDAMMRIDQNPLYRSSWSFNDDSIALGHKNDHKAFLGLLDQLARGHNLYMQVGDESGTIPLKGSAQAVAIFKQRIAYLNHFKNTLRKPKAQSQRSKSKTVPATAATVSQAKSRSR